MRHTIKTRDQIHVKKCRFFFFGKNMGESVSSKYGENLIGSFKKSATDALKTASKRVVQRSARAIGDLV